jgi:hypothetical protein
MTILTKHPQVLLRPQTRNHALIPKRKGPTETRPLYLTHSDRMWMGICLSNPRHDNNINLSPKLMSPGSTKTPMTRPHFWCRVSPPRFAQTQLQLFTTRQTELQRSKFIIHNLQNSPTAQAASLQYPHQRSSNHYLAKSLTQRKVPTTQPSSPRSRHTWLHIQTSSRLQQHLSLQSSLSPQNRDQNFSTTSVLAFATICPLFLPAMLLDQSSSPPLPFASSTSLIFPLSAVIFLNSSSMERRPSPSSASPSFYYPIPHRQTATPPCIPCTISSNLLQQNKICRSH